MRRLRYAFAATTLLLAAAALAADAPDISGTWTTSFDSQVGKQDYTYTFKVEGGKLTGHAKSNLGEGDLSDGKVDKDNVTFVEHLNYQGMMLDITYQGKIVSPDEIKFKRDVAGQGGEEFTAKRSK
ncbi:MAG TPA: hypothetical protein VMH77_00265 [Steroidobacteraceae bacterium]|nr:hypothetical protein [Steroidobacteraceae bacterium]